MLDAREKAAFNKALGGKQSERLPIIFNALADATRCKIARLLIKKGKHELSVGDICDVIGISQSSASQHLKVLEITGVVNKTRRGRHVFYHVEDNDPIVAALIKAVL